MKPRPRSRWQRRRQRWRYDLVRAQLLVAYHWFGLLAFVEEARMLFRAYRPGATADWARWGSGVGARHADGEEEIWVGPGPARARVEALLAAVPVCTNYERAVRGPTAPRRSPAPRRADGRA